MHARKFLLLSQFTGEWQAGLLPACNAGAAAQPEEAWPRGRDLSRTLPHRAGLSRPSSTAHATAPQMTSQRPLCAATSDSVLQVEGEAKVCAGFQHGRMVLCGCWCPGEGTAFLQNLKNTHSSSWCNQNLSEIFHKRERHPGTAKRVTVRASPGQGGISKIQVSRLSGSRERFNIGCLASQTMGYSGAFPSVIPALDRRRLSHYLQRCCNWHSATHGFDYCKSAFSNEKSFC